MFLRLLAMAAIAEDVKQLLQNKAALLRIHSVEATTAAGSGHPTSSASAADILSVLFFSVMRYDPKDPGNLKNDAFVLSKGHAAPVLYAAWAEAGFIPQAELLKLRKLDSDLEGHPTPRLKFVDVATGSLGQGLSAGVGLAIAAKRLDQSDRRIFVLMGDGESAEGSVWEAAHSAAYMKLDNLCATIDINRLGQSEATMDEHDTESYRKRWDAFGWNAIVVDGHDLDALLSAYETAAKTKDRPTIVLAKTLKGKGLLDVENKLGAHGKPIEGEKAVKAVAALRESIHGSTDGWQPKLPSGKDRTKYPKLQVAPQTDLPYNKESKPEATRKAFGEALASVGKRHEEVVVLDGDVKNSTYTEDFEKVAPERFFQMFIAEQNMVGAAMGLSAAGRVPFATSFACFLGRAYDFARMAAIGNNNIKLVGSHSGISIGEDGPSQMALEDLAIFTTQPNYTVLYPTDPVSAWRATELVTGHLGPCYIRTSRPKGAVLYDATEPFALGKSKVLRESDKDQAVVVGAGVTLYEALKAYDELAKEGIAVTVVDLFSLQPIDSETLLRCAKAAGGRVITVEDHYAHGGIGDLVASVLAEDGLRVHKLAVREIPRSGQPEELLEKYGISAKAIVSAVRSFIAQ